MHLVIHAFNNSFNAFTQVMHSFIQSGSQSVEEAVPQSEQDLFLGGHTLWRTFT